MLHGQAIDANDWIFKSGYAFEDFFCDELLSCLICVHDGADEVLGDIGIVCEQLLRIFWKAVAAVSKAGVVVVRPNAGIKSYAVDDVFGIQPLAHCVCIKLIEVGNPKR